MREQAWTARRDGFIASPMSPRLKKLIGSLGVLVFLAGYVWAATRIAEVVPRTVWAETPFYLLAGVLWGVPLIPLIRWMNREPDPGPPRG